MIMRMMMFTMRMGPYYSNTFKLREMYYQYSHVVENNAQHKWRAEKILFLFPKCALGEDPL